MRQLQNHIQQGEEIFSGDEDNEAFWKDDFTVQKLTEKMSNMSCDMVSTLTEGKESSDDDIPIIAFRRKRQPPQKAKNEQHFGSQHPQKIIYFS